MTRCLRSGLMKIAALALILTAGNTSVSAQSADKVLKSAAKALGGEKVLRAIQSKSIQGTIVRPSDSATGNYSLITRQPNLFVESIDLSGFETVTGNSGRSIWKRDSRDGLRTLTGKPSSDGFLLATYLASRWFDYKRDKSRVVLQPATTVNGVSAQTVLLTSMRGVQAKLFFDTRTGLPLRDEIPLGETTRTTDYSDYRVVNGVMEPHAISILIGNDRYEVKINKIDHNVTLAQTAFDFPKVSTEPLPDIPTLLSEVSKNGEEIDRLLEKYTYVQTITNRVFDQKGNLQDKNSEAFELTFYKGNRLRKQIEKNGQPLTEKDLDNENKRLEKSIREIEKKEAEKQRKAAAGSTDEDSEDRRVKITDILRASTLLNPRRERFRSRDVIVFDFEPNPSYKPVKSYEKFFGKMAGVIWIDDADKQVARVEVRLVESFKIAGGLLASLKEGGSFVLEQDRVNNEIWLPTRADINLIIKIFLVKNMNNIQTVEYGNYQRFNVESEKEKLAAPAVTGSSEKKPH